MSLDTNIRSNEKRRRSFFELAAKVFDLSFEDWHRRGYWTHSYIPYALFDGDRAVANVSVNIISFLWEGTVRRYVQLGTVMTAPDWRNSGLARFLINRVLADWRDKGEAIYLFANESVLDFYPKFGFIKASEYQPSAWVAAQAGPVVKLDLARPADLELLTRHYQKSNPFSALAMIGNQGLTMFHCSSYLKDCLYYFEDCQAVVIVEQEAGELICYDVYADGQAPLTSLLVRLVAGDGQMVRFGFALKDSPRSAALSPRPNDEALFLLQGLENLFANHKIMFPLLSHA